MRAIALALILGAATSASADGPFRYQPERAPAPGTLWHFVKSNRDGSRPWKLDAYFAAPGRIEVVKWAEGASDFVEVFADIDLSRGMPQVSTQWNTERGRRQPRMWATAAPGRPFHVQLADGKQLDLDVPPGSVHFWGFDLMGAAVMLPHLVDPAVPFELTFIDPNRPGKAGSPALVDTGRFEPAGEETVHGVRCRKYRLAGPVFDGAEGSVWIDAKTGRLEQAEHPVRTSTDWTDWKLELVGSETTDALAWESFKLGLADKQRGPGGVSAAGAMKKAYDTDGLKAAFVAGDAARKRAAQAWADDLNTFGYALLGLGKTQDAIAVFERASREFADSANAWDSLGEAQAAAGRTADALASYRRSLALDPQNDNAKEQIAKLAVPKR
jgi:hypothetical protein